MADAVFVHTGGRGRPPVAGRLRNICQDAAHLLVPFYIDPESLVEVELSDGCIREGRVLYCHPFDGNFLLSVAFPTIPAGADRRTDGPRLPVDHEPVRLRPVTHRAESAAPSLEAHLIDRSPAGLGLLAPISFAPGTLLQIETASGVLFGEVRHARPAADGRFRLGLAIETSEPRRAPAWDWSPLLRRLLQRQTSE